MVAPVLFALFALLPPAQEPPSIASTRQDPRFHALAEQQFLVYEATLATHCKDIHPDWTHATHLLYGPVEVDKDGYPFKATWAEQVPGTACGQPRRFRTMVLVRDGRISTARMLPGDSGTSEQLENDLRDSLLGAAEGFARDIKPSCAVDVLDTTLLSAPPKPWQEVWVVNICGHRLKVPITFIPDAKGPGTSFSISSANITEVR
jgi:hypothetical protein